MQAKSPTLQRRDYHGPARSDAMAITDSTALSSALNGPSDLTDGAVPGRPKSPLGCSKKIERNHDREKTLEALTDEEWEMIETIRENREDDGFRLLIERKHGIWEIELKSAKVPYLERGAGVDFNQAWGNITEAIP